MNVIRGLFQLGKIEEALAFGNEAFSGRYKQTSPQTSEYFHTMIRRLAEAGGHDELVVSLFHEARDVGVHLAAGADQKLSIHCYRDALLAEANLGNVENVEEVF